jgi:two-component system, cell cycle sensor histidine kinase and response regulator CckA
MGTAIAVPMFDGDARIGPLNLATFREQGVIEPTAEELDFVIQVASILSVVIARLRAEKAHADLEAKVISSQKFEALGRLAGEVAHDFNNILLAVLGNAELAEEELGVHPAVAYLLDIREATLRAAALSRRLLAFSRGQVLSKRVLEVNPLVQRCVQMLERLIPESIQLACTLSPQAGSIQGDPGQLDQILMNLVLNARDALPRGGSIHIDTRNVRVEETFVANHSNVLPGCYVLLSVTDDGEGMDADTQRRIFEPFFTTKSEEHGSGLGLSVVQGIVSQHSGHIHVYSEPGLGTTFKVYLPLSEQRADDVGSLLSIRPEKLGGNERVLLVDDAQHVRITVARMLRRAGYEVVEAEGGRQALLESQPVDLLLADIAMPDVDGLSLAAELTTRWPNTRVLLMTGYAPSRLGQVRWPHITKPFTPSQLLTLVRALLDAATAEPA